jgi:hypothetical protein
LSCGAARFDGLDRLPLSSERLANAYASNCKALHSGEIGEPKALTLPVTDATGVGHAALLRMQAPILPVRTLRFEGGH